MSNIVAFHTGALGAYPVTEAIRRVGTAGYDGVELNAEKLPWADPHVSPALSRAERRAIRKSASDAGVVITSISAHVSLVGGGPAARRAAVEFSKGCVDLALSLGAAVTHGLTGAAPGGVPRKEAWHWAVDAVSEIADYAEWHGVRFGIEPVIGMLVSNAQELGQLLQELHGHQVGVNFDPSHLIVSGDDPVEVARRYGTQIVAVHLKDAKVTAEGFEFPPLGMGAVDFDALAEAFRSSGYGGPLVVEYEAHAFGGYSWTEEDILGQSLAFVRSLFSQG